MAPYPARPRRSTLQGSSRQRVTVGLVNNMSDEALKATERQFGELIKGSAAGIDVQLRLFALSRTQRSAISQNYILTNYEYVRSITDHRLDALIITGAQPHTIRLRDEVYWQELTDLIDWAKENTISTIFSCLAAHAAVLHLDGVERQPLLEKFTGVFDFEPHERHPFADWEGRAISIPHSRYNGLSQTELERSGYDVLTSSPKHGVDSFTKDFGSQFIFLQGHPEYDGNSLAREYRRDMRRYLRGETDRRPRRPQGYFSAEAERGLDALEIRAQEDPRSLTNEDLLEIDALAPEAQWRDAAATFYRNWIRMIAASGRGVATDAGLSPGPYVRVREAVYQGN